MCLNQLKIDCEQLVSDFCVHHPDKLKHCHHHHWNDFPFFLWGFYFYLFIYSFLFFIFIYSFLFIYFYLFIYLINALKKNNLHKPLPQTLVAWDHVILNWDIKISIFALLDVLIILRAHYAIQGKLSCLFCSSLHTVIWFQVTNDNS